MAFCAMITGCRRFRIRSHRLRNFRMKLLDPTFDRLPLAVRRPAVGDFVCHTPQPTPPFEDDEDEEEDDDRGSGGGNIDPDDDEGGFDDDDDDEDTLWTDRRHGSFVIPTKAGIISGSKEKQMGPESARARRLACG